LSRAQAIEQEAQAFPEEKDPTPSSTIFAMGINSTDVSLLDVPSSRRNLESMRICGATLLPWHLSSLMNQ
jgi:hypothetical protein